MPGPATQELKTTNPINEASSQLKSHLVKKQATSVLAKVIGGAARANLLSMMFGATSANADPVIDPKTGVNRFTGKTEFTPMFPG